MKNFCKRLGAAVGILVCGALTVGLGLTAFALGATLVGFAVAHHVASIRDWAGCATQHCFEVATDREGEANNSLTDKIDKVSFRKKNALLHVFGFGISMPPKKSKNEESSPIASSHTSNKPSFDFR